MAEELMTKGALDQAALVRSGEVSARELVETSLRTIEQLNGEINAFVTLAAERALEEADSVSPGDERPLAGVPIAIKDLPVLTEGIRTTFGSRAVGAFVPPIDSSPVRRLRGAGAIVVGKTNTPELGIPPTTEPLRFGPTRNPWDTGRTPGGSSGGSAAAVATRMVRLAHGSDGGGSIRIPASCCALVGLKPARGRVSPAPLPEDLMGLVTDGVLTRSVAETAVCLDLLSGYELGDSYPAPPPGTSFAEAAERDPPKLRVAFTREALSGAPVAPDCAAAVDRAVEALESLGHEVEEAELAVDVDTFREAFIQAWIVSGGSGVKGLGQLVGHELDREELEPLTRSMAEAAERASAVEFVSAVSYMRAASRGALQLWADYDVFLTPTLAQPPIPLGELAPHEGEPLEDTLRRGGNFAAFTPPTNVTGQPAISLPLHQSGDGLPIGVHLVGASAAEETLLSVSGQLERAGAFSEQEPPVLAAA